MYSKDKRREVRLGSKDDDLLVEASGLAGVSVSEFILDRALSDAETLVEAHHSIILDAANYTKFLAVLDSPVTVNEALAAQVAKARPLKQTD